MKPRALILIALPFVCGSLLADTSAKGAKELFYNPMDGAVVSASPLNSPKPSRGQRKSGPSAAAPTKPPTGTPIAQRKTPPKGQGNVRRQIEQEAVPKTSPLGLSYWIELVGPDGTGQQVTDGRIFRSGEKIRLHFRSNADGNLALIQLGSSGTSSVLFPDPAKGLDDSRINAGDDRILPKEAAWFRFDNTPGTEKILVLFARSPQELENFSIQPSMDATATRAVMGNVDRIRGGKDLVIEMETETASEIGGYAVNLRGKPVVMEIQLKHQ